MVIQVLSKRSYLAHILTFLNIGRAMAQKELNTIQALS